MRWGQGSLQEIDHVPFVRPLVKLAATAAATAEIPGLIDDAWDEALRPHPARRSSTSRSTRSSWRRRRPSRVGAAPHSPAAPDARALDRAVALLRDAERPVIMAGTNLYWGRGEDALRELAEAAGRPGVPQRARRAAASPPTTRCSSRARAAPGSRAPTSRSWSACRWTSGSASAPRSGEDCELVALDVAEPEREHPRAGRRRALRRPRGDAAHAGGRRGRRRRHERLGRAACAAIEDEKRAAERAQLEDDARAAAPAARSTASSARCSTATRS